MPLSPTVQFGAAYKIMGQPQAVQQQLRELDVKHYIQVNQQMGDEAVMLTGPDVVHFLEGRLAMTLDPQVRNAMMADAFAENVIKTTGLPEKMVAAGEAIARRKNEISAAAYYNELLAYVETLPEGRSADAKAVINIQA